MPLLSNATVSVRRPPAISAAGSAADSNEAAAIWA